MLALYICLPTLAVLLAVWLFLIGTHSGRKMKKFKYVKYAHRGLHGTVDADSYAAENSLTAFERAAARGFGIELDVRLSSDGVVMVFHDDTLDRVTGVSGKFNSFSAEELSAIRLSDTSDTVPSFAEVLALVNGRVPLLVEIKEDGFDHSLTEKCMSMLKDYKGEYIVESFSPLALGVSKKCAPTVLRGFLCDKLTDNEKYRSVKYRVIQRHLLNFIARPHFIAASKERYSMLPIPLIRALFRPAFVAWTIRSEEEEKAAYSHGFTGVIFENYLPCGTVNNGNK